MLEAYLREVTFVFGLVMMIEIYGLPVVWLHRRVVAQRVVAGP